MARIGIISTMAGYPWGGSEYLWAAMAERAVEQGYEVFVSILDWSANHPIVKQLQSQGAVVLPRQRSASLSVRARRKASRLFPALSVFSAPSAYEPIFDCQPDVICISQGGSYDIAYIPELYSLLSSRSVPYTVVCHFNADTHSPDEQTRKVAQKILFGAESVAFVSQHNLKLAERQLAHTLQNAVVVQNPVNLSDRTPVPWYDQPTVCFASVARLEAAAKGQDVLFEALSSPLWRERDWQCNLYGAGPDQDYLKALAQHYGIGDRVNFKGHVSDVRAIWAENHLLVMPSRAEGTPLSLIEAMLCGRPSVVTDVGGNAEWVEESQTGFIAEAPTARSFAAALERAWVAQASWKHMGNNAHKYSAARSNPSPGQSLLELVLEATTVNSLCNLS